MNKNIILFIVAAALLLLAGCAKEQGSAGGGTITIEASVGSMTKVSHTGDGIGTKFTAGDKIAVYGWTGSADAVPATRVVDGVVNTLGTDGKWTPESPMLWKNVKDQHYFLGVFPARTITDFTADPYTLNPAEYTESDLLVAKNLDGVTASQGAVDLPFDHLMAKLVVNLIFRTQWDDTPTVSSVSALAKTKATVNYLTKDVTVTDDSPVTVGLAAATSASTGYALTYSGIQVPQEGVRKVTVTIDNNDYVYESATDIPLKAGKYTTLGLIVGKDNVLELSSISITDWESGTPIEGETAQPGAAFALDAYFPADQLPLKSKWESGDVIFVLCQVAGKSFVSDTYANYLKMTHNGSAWTTAEIKNGEPKPGCLGLEEGDQVTMRAVYLPYDNNVGVDFDGNGRYVFGGTFECYLTATLIATVSGGRLSGCFDLALPERVMLFTIAHSGGYSVSSLFLREPHLTPLGLKGFTADLDAVNADPVHGAPLYGQPYGNSAADAGYAFCAELDEGLDNVWTDYHFTRDMNFGDFAGYGKRLALSGASGRVLELPALGASDWQAPPCAPVDLGINIDDPVRGGKKRIYWASCNVGASAPEEHGDHFAWGETEPYYSCLDPLTWKDGKGDGYAWSSYFDSTDGGYSFTKYNTAGPTVLEAADDAATANWGAPWRMPTDAEWIALLDKENCTNEVTTQNGEKGRLFTSKKNGNTLFLPAASFRDGTGFLNASISNLYGLYWSSSLRTDKPKGAYYMYFTISGSGIDRDVSDRRYGLSVRPVTD